MHVLSGILSFRQKKISHFQACAHVNASFLHTQLHRSSDLSACNVTHGSKSYIIQNASVASTFFPLHPLFLSFYSLYPMRTFFLFQNDSNNYQINYRELFHWLQNRMTSRKCDKQEPNNVLIRL